MGDPAVSARSSLALSGPGRLMNLFFFFSFLFFSFHPRKIFIWFLFIYYLFIYLLLFNNFFREGGMGNSFIKVIFLIANFSPFL